MLLLQGEIVIVVLGEVQCLRLGWNPLAGIVFEFATFRRLGYHTPFDTERLLVVQLCAVNAVFTGVGHFLSEQHSGYLIQNFLYYTPTVPRILLEFFDFLKKYTENNVISKNANILHRGNRHFSASGNANNCTK